MRLTLSRVAHARTLLVAAAAATLVTSVLLTAFVVYAWLLPVAGVRAAISDAPVDERSLLVTASAGEDASQIAAQDDAVRELLAGGVGGVPLRVTTGGYATSQQLPGYGDADALVAYLPDVAEHAELVAGRWPGQVTEDDALVEAALPVEVADELGVGIGDLLVVHDGINQQDRSVLVAGLWRASHAEAVYWRLVRGQLDGGAVGPFVVHPQEFAAGYSTLASQVWLGEADPGELAAAGMTEVVAGLAALEAELLHQRIADEALAENARVSTGMGELGERLLLALVVNRSGLVLPAALLTVVAGYGLVLVARLLAAHRRGENALLRARGASRLQMMRVSVAEALLVVAPAALLAAPASAWLVSYVDTRAGGRSLGLAGDLAGYGLAGPPLAWLVGVLAAAGCAVALAASTFGRRRTWVAEQQQRSRPGKRAVVQRAGTDVALVALAVLAWTQLHQYGTAVAPRDVGGLGVDPLLVAAPVVGVLAGTAVVLRLLPLATRLGVRLAGRRDAFAALLGMWQADRRPHAGPVLLLMLAVATAVLAPVVAATWQQSQRDQAAQLVGADLRLAGTDRAAMARAAQISQRPEVEVSMPVERGFALLPEGARTTVLAIDSQHAAEVARMRHDGGHAAPSELFNALHDGRPALELVALPEDAPRLIGEVTFTAPEPIIGEIPLLSTFAPMFAVHSERLWIHVMDEHGVIWPLRLGIPEPADPVTVDVALPPGAVAVAGLSAGFKIESLARVEDGELILFDDRVPAPAASEMSWSWDLAVLVDDSTVPLEIPDSWQPGLPPGDGPGEADDPDSNVPQLRRTGSGVGTTVGAEVDATQHRAQQIDFMVAGPLPDGGIIPVLATPDVLTAAGSQPGEVIQLDDVGFEVVGTLPRLPGTEDGSGVAVDLRWLSLDRFATVDTSLPEVTEWWLATGASAQLADQAAAEGLQWFDRDAEQQHLLADPLGGGVLLALWTAAAAGALLAAFGLVVDARANAVRRGRELAVLHTLGASPPALGRALVVEQAVLAGLGAAAGAAVGVGVAAAMGTSLVLTPTGAAPIPEPLLRLPADLFALSVVGLFLVAVGLGAMVASRARRDVVAGALRIGEE